MANRTLTAANSVFLLSIAGLYTTPQRLQGYATDDAFRVEAVELAETMMGVDGIMSAGYTPMPTKQTVSLQADSASSVIFDTWATAMKTAREVYFANGTISLPSLGTKYALTRGVLTSVPIMASVKKTLQPRSFVITWENVSPAPF